VPGTAYPIAKLNPEAVTVYPGDHAHSGAVVNGIGRIGKMKGGKSAVFRDECIADDLVREAGKFLRAAGTQPFFLFFSANDIHAPRWPHSRFRGMSEHGLRGDAMVSLDWSVGAILKMIDDLDLTHSTLIIFSSDNGPVYMDGGYQDGCEINKFESEVDRGHDASGPFRGGKYQIHEGGTRVPFIVRWPGEVVPGISDALFTQTDLLATFADLIQIEIPKGEAGDSRPELEVLTGRSREGVEFIVQTSFKQRALRRGKMKYIEKPQQLYDLSVDPAETRNLSGQKSELEESLEELLNACLEKPLR
jgi:arylsulfatase A-like enzyme